MRPVNRPPVVVGPVQRIGGADLVLLVLIVLLRHDRRLPLHDATRKGLHVHAAEITSSAGKHAVYLLRRIGCDAIEIRFEAAVRAHFVAVSDAAQATLQILVALRQHPRSAFAPPPFSRLRVRSVSWPVN